MNNQAYNASAAYNGKNGPTTYWYQPIQNVHHNVMVPDIDNRKNIPEYLKMNNRDSLKLLSLLSDWKMGFLFRTLYDELVDVEALKYITPAQCDVLLSNYPLGIRIKFVGKLMDWKHLALTEIINNNSTLPSFPSEFM
eukprot:XP_016663528.1 PREDICTED: uncharacterized protein LOC107884927 [Acyrthosiphon pisum]